MLTLTHGGERLIRQLVRSSPSIAVFVCILQTSTFFVAIFCFRFANYCLPETPFNHLSLYCFKPAVNQSNQSYKSQIHVCAPPSFLSLVFRSVLFVTLTSLLRLYTPRHRPVRPCGGRIILPILLILLPLVLINDWHF